ncbi:esterase [Catenovulum sp. SM1970]|uniref:alpha/beta hydrolase n=1 Tax=Marinifaba aquimaris TaxID=2741323 RepID=UPI00157198A7|nr:alpha/beta hydrolase-fold protein [Marinifaba aquimaris]NTS75881.1 esterase [Marinifaba aquimaris]
MYPFILTALALYLFCNSALAQSLNQVKPKPIPNVSSGQIKRLSDFQSKWVSNRDIDVWLPNHYSNSNKKFAVLYMHDGQMLFDKNITWNNQEWGVDETATKLMQSGETRDFIVIGIHNAGKYRHDEYFPEKPFYQLDESIQNQLYQTYRKDGRKLFADKVKSDNYLKFITMELKPYIDQHFNVYNDLENTFIMGSSMGGLVSLYAISEYPNVFKAAACMSTHWPGNHQKDNNPIPDTFFNYMQQNLPSPISHRLYFDYGTETLDAMYPRLQLKADKVIKGKGYNHKNWQTRVFIGAAHTEQDWQARLAIPLKFIFAQ